MGKTELLSFCGLDCSKCPAYLAEKTGETRYKKDAFRKWGAHYPGLKMADIGCSGCLGYGKMWPGCAICGVRACGRQKGVRNCGECAQYPCARLESLWKKVKGGKANCEKIRRLRVE